MLQGGSSASVGGGGAAAMGLRWQQLWQCLAPVVKVATVVAWGFLQQFDEWKKIKKERKITHLSWRAAGPIYACDACEGRCNGVAGVMAGSRWRWL